MITSLKIQIEEEKIIEEVLRSQLEEKEKMIGSLEEKVISLRNDLQRKICRRRALEYWIKSLAFKDHQMTDPS